MKIHEITVQEAKFAKPSIVYHGTSERYLKSILSQGLDARRSGTGWGSNDAYTSEMTRDLVAIGGVYMTGSLDIAYEAARDVIDNIGNYNPLIVVVQYQTRHGALDEDRVDEFVNKRISKLIGQRQNNIYIALYDAMTDPGTGNEFMTFYDDAYKKYAEKHPDGLALSKSIAAYELRRRAAHRFKRTGIDTEEVAEAASERDVDPKDIAKLLPEDAKKGEEDYRKVLKRATIVLKNLAHTSKDDKVAGNVRSRETIGFSGANKIVSIFSIKENEQTVKVHYGKLPESTKRQLSNLPGYRFTELTIE